MQEKLEKEQNSTNTIVNCYILQGIITTNFEELGIGDKETGYIGLAMSISCAIFATVISVLVAKKLKTKLKVTFSFVHLLST